MMLRHTAALALVGWYLMVPPMSPDGNSDRYDSEPFPMGRQITV